MLEADNQLVLDEYVGRLISSDRFEEEARLWPNYQTDYAAVVGLAGIWIEGCCNKCSAPVCEYGEKWWF